MSSRHEADQPQPTGTEPPAPRVPRPDVDQTGHVEATRRLQRQDLQTQRAEPSPAGRRPRRRSRAGQSPPPMNAAPPPGPPGSAPRQGSLAAPQSRRQDSPWYFPWWSLALLILVVGGAAFTLLAFAGSVLNPETPGDQPPRVQVMTSQPTLSQDFFANSNANNGAAGPQMNNPTAIPQIAPQATVPLPTPAPSPSLPPGDFSIGTLVTVTGVGNSGLNIRADPGLSSTLRFLAYDGDVFVLVDGPQNTDGLSWWRLEDPNDPSRYGWAARNYLMAADES